MKRACDIGKQRKIDPALRRYTLVSGAAFGLAGLVGGFFAGFSFVTHEAAAASPLMEKFFLNLFISISGGAAGLIIGAFIGSVAYRIREKK